MDSNRDIKNKRWLSQWGQIRKRGFLRFWLIYGLLYFILTFLAIFAVVHIFNGSLPQLEVLLSEKLLTNLFTAFLVGLTLATLRWIWNELRFRRLGAKYPNAIRIF